MRRLVYLASVRADLVDILTYIAGESGSIAVAQGFVAQLRDRCRELASKPGTLGRARPELHPEIRSVAHKGYVIFFPLRRRPARGGQHPRRPPRRGQPFLG